MTIHFKRLFFLLLFSSACVYADALPETPYVPWFTGPLLVPTPVNGDPHHPAIQACIVGICTYGTYKSNWGIKKEHNTWSISPQIYLELGFTQNFGLQVLVPVISNFHAGHSSTNLVDTSVWFGYQISNDVKGSWIPDFRLMIQEIFPTGSYSKLNPNYNGIDSTGFGSFQTGPGFAMRKIFYLSDHVFSLYWSPVYLFPSMVDVEGHNSFGGGPGVKGKERPGKTFINYISGEYSITQNWVFAFDTFLFVQRKSHFSGDRALLPIKAVTLPFSVQFSIAPEIEYNFSARQGFLGGLWFTAFGKNSLAFASAFITYTYVF